LRQTLSRDGHVVAAAASFRAAAELIASFRPDLLVADVHLGTYSGLHVAVHARRAYPGLPVIVTYQLLDRVLERDARRMGMAFVARPLTNPAFLRQVRAAFRSIRPVLA
jgi:DNA-binding response OmpR family regulator